MTLAYKLNALADALERLKSASDRPIEAFSEQWWRLKRAEEEARLARKGEK